MKRILSRRAFLQGSAAAAAGGLLGGAITMPGVECVGAADLFDGRHTLAKEITANPSLPTTRHYRELLDRKDIDCIVAAGSDHWHRRGVGGGGDPGAGGLPRE